jgi:hypothetical protein
MATTQPFVDIASLSGFLESIGSYNVDLIFAPQNMLRSGALLLYHYTDLNGLVSIVENHDLWLTHSKYSNDSEEMTHGISVAKKTIEDAITARTHDPVYLDTLSKLSMQAEGVYICCFCEEDNLLSQWRGYGANGTGVSLQMAPTEFANVAGPDNPHGLLRFWKVFYDPQIQTQIISQAIAYYAPSVNAGQDPMILARKAADAIRFFIPTFKNSDFAEEKEWRLLFTPDPAITIQPRFRVGRNMLVPFYSLHELTGAGLPQLPLRQIRIGPSVYKQLNSESAKALLQRNGYLNVSVLVSDMPYRA